MLEQFIKIAYATHTCVFRTNHSNRTVETEGARFPTVTPPNLKIRNVGFFFIFQFSTNYFFKRCKIF